MNPELKDNLTRTSSWIRVAYMVLFAIVYNIAELVGLLVVLFQIGSTLITGKRNEFVSGFGRSLSRYIFQIWSYLTYSSEQRPFPFMAWPSSAPGPDLDSGRVNPSLPDQH